MNTNLSIEPLLKVRTPFATYWREFRYQMGPVLFFGGILAGIVVLWREAGSGSTQPGLGQGVQSLVTSPQAGRLQQVLVAPFQIVEAGEPLAVVMPGDTQTRLDLLRTELALLQLRQQPSVAEDNAMNFEQIRIEWLRTKSELAVARINLERAENELRRNEPLYREKLIAEDVYDLSLKTRDALRAEIAEKEAAESLIKRRLAALESLGVPKNPLDDDGPTQLAERLDALQSTMSTQSEPITLTAPMKGMIQAVYRQKGEHILEGEPLAIILSLHSEYIVGYLRQPYPVDPKTGLKVQVSTRDRQRRQFWSEIVQVGSQVEVITNALAFLRPGALVDAGLPFLVSLPNDVEIRPGEIVDLRISNRQNRSNLTNFFSPFAARRTPLRPQP